MEATAVAATMGMAATMAVDIGAVAITHPDQTSTWCLSPTSMRRHRAMGQTTTVPGTRAGVLLQSASGIRHQPLFWTLTARPARPL